MAIALVMVLGAFSATGAKIKTPGRFASTPHAITGYVYWPNGTLDITVPIPVTITNNRTGQKGVVLVDVVAGGNPDGTYQVDLANSVFYPSGYLSTDVIYVNCTYQNMWAKNQTIVGALPFSMCNLRMSSLPFGPKLVKSAIGGTVSSTDGSITLAVPAGSIVSDKVIYGLETTQSLHGAFRSLNLLPKGLVFSTPATLTWSYASLDIGLVRPESLAIFTSDGGAWEKLPSFVDTTSMVVTAQVSHFSNFSIGGAAAFGNQTALTNVYPGTSNAAILDLTIINSDLATPDTLNYIRVVSNSTLNSDISSVSLWNDLDNDGLVTGADSQIGTTRPLIIGQANFTGLAEPLPADSHINMLVCVNVNAGAVAGDYLDLRIPQNGIGLSNAGLVSEQIDPAGNVTVWAELVDPHVVYGYITNYLGPVQFAWVNLTNNRTGSTENLMTDTLGRYDVNLGLMPGSYLDGDTIFVAANDTLGQAGWNVTAVSTALFGERCDIFLGGGPVASDETPANASIVTVTDQNITVNITNSPVLLDLATIILEVEGVNFTIADGNLTYAGETLTFNTSKAFGTWSDGQIVNVTLWQANDTVGNPCQNAPYVWWFQVSLGTVNKAPDIRVHKAGANLNITWNAIANATSYNVYRSLAIDGTGFNFLAPLATTGSLYYVDTGALADTSNYSYVVRGASAGGEGPKSNIGWKLRKQLIENAATSDINWIGLPYNSDLKFAQDLIVDLGGSANVNSVSRWVATSQSYQNKLPIGGLNWPITPGEGLLVNMKTTLIYTIVGSYNNTTMVNLIENAATSDINWIALPYHSQLKFAQDVIVNLGGSANINSVSRWVATSQSYQNKLPIGGLNWPTTPGDALLINVKVTISNYNLGPVLYP